MEQLNSKLYEKYKNLKKRKLFEEEWDQKRDAEIRNYQLATEDLIEELRKENERLYGELSSLQEQYAETEKILLEESRKTKELSSEVGRLQILLSQKKDTNDGTLIRSPNITPEARSKKAFTVSPEKKTPNSCSNKGGSQQEVVVAHYNCQEKHNMPDCCRGYMDNTEGGTGKSSIMCVFHTLIEFLVGMKFSVGIQTEELCLSVIHEKSGYSFSLILIRHESGQGDLMYRVSSLGTLERVALDWMKEDVIFSMTMCPVFFQRISRVVGRG
uniref:DUF7806 domain-containing protein n=1 Tax=Ananas comosus var. bracteatus TaxID=296719 RepID=A0A6V7PRA6_ANACO|nr:unnamed protein product [Ananas comosus var. bracteatus]